MTTKDTEAGAKIEPCPWCKCPHPDERTIIHRGGIMDDAHFSAACSCGATGPSQRSRQAAVEAWNSIVQSVNERAGLLAENKRLREALEKARICIEATCTADSPIFGMIDAALRSVQEGAPKA